MTYTKFDIESEDFIYFSASSKPVKPSFSKQKKDWNDEYKDKKRNKKAKKDYSEQRNRKRGEIQD